MSKRVSETECAALVVSWLTDTGWDVYQEVRGGRSDVPVDVVATRGRLCWAIEVKASCSWKLLGQCVDRRRIHGAHIVSAACPLPRESYALDAIRKAFAAVGVGLLQLQPDARPGYVVAPVEEIVQPTLRRVVLPAYDLRANLSVEHKTHAAAGSASGAGWTRFKATTKALLEYAEANPGALLSDAVKAIEHHYASDAVATATLRTQVDRGYVPGVRVAKSRVGNRDRVVVYALSAGR